MGSKHRKKSRSRRLHRWIGVGASLFILFMATSGVLISHSDGISLDQKKISHAALLDWYGLAAPADIQSFRAAESWLSFAGSQLYLDGVFVSSAADGIGAIFNSDQFIVAGRNEILLIDQQGRLIEKQAWGQTGGQGIALIGLSQNNTVVLESADTLWVSDADLLAWQPLAETSADVVWSMKEPAPEAVHQAISRHYRGNGLSMERVLLDLHSGRIFGQAGVLVYDLLALLIGFLAISGLVLWVRMLRSKNGKTPKY